MKSLQEVYNTKKDNFNKFCNFLGKEDNKNIIAHDLFLDVLPDHFQESYLNERKKEIDEAEKLDCKVNFHKNLILYKKLLNSLCNCKTNNLTIKAFSELENNKTILSNLKKFKSFNGFAKIPEYDLFSNITGRVVIKDGPNILTLPKRNRSILESSFKEEGDVISIDFLTLEPRIILGILGKNKGEDIYESLNEELGLNLDRSIIKRAIISVIYGSSSQSIQGISDIKSKELFNCIIEYFELDKIYEKALNIDEFGIRRNYFGRPLWNLEEERRNILINNYVQSSAVDLSLTYFSKIVNSFNSDFIRPLFILHDALILDVKNSEKEKLSSIINEGYVDKKLGKFPVTVDIFNKNIKES